MASQSLIKFIEEISTGLHPSMPPNKVPLWQTGANVVFQDEAVQPMPGQFIAFSKPENAPVRGVIEFRSTVFGGRGLFWGTPTALYSWVDATGVVADRTRLSGPYTDQDPTLWSLANFGEHVFAVNGASGDAPQRWNTLSANFVDLSAVPSSDFWADARAEIVRRYGPFMLMYGMDTANGGGQACKWCSEDNTINWVPSGINSAGDLALRELGGPILAVENLGGGHGVYAEDRVLMLEFIGAPLWFGTTRLMAGIGALSKNSIVTIGRLNYGMGPRGFFKTDGYEFSYIDQPSIHDFVYDNLNQDLRELVVGWPNMSEGHVWWSMPWGPGATDNNLTVGYNYENDTWTINEYARTAASDGGSFPYAITFDVTGTPYQQGTSATTSGEADPLQLVATAQFEAAWDDLGWDEFPFGGIWIMNG